jgi:hypothetical protein
MFISAPLVAMKNLVLLPTIHPNPSFKGQERYRIAFTQIWLTILKA